MVGFIEFLVVLFLGPEELDDALAREILFHHRINLADLALAFFELRHREFHIAHNENGHERERRDDDERHLVASDEHHDDGEDKQEQALGDRRERRIEILGNAIDVIAHARHRIPSLVGIEIG